MTGTADHPFSLEDVAVATRTSRRQPAQAAGRSDARPADASHRDRWLLMRLLALGNTSPSLAERLLAELGSLGAILAASNERLRQLGADDNGIALLQLLRDALGLLLERRQDHRAPIRSPAQLADQLHAQMAWLKVEQVRAAFLDAGRRLLRIEVLSSGSLSRADVYPREVARRALELSASAVILAHNHPSGDPSPSTADIALTARIQRALAALDVQLLDHLVVSPARIVSMAASGLIPVAEQ